MVRRKKNGGGIKLMAAAPWPATFVLGIVLFWIARYGLSWALSTSSNSFIAAIGQQLSHSAFTLISWGLLAFCWIASLVSFVKGRSRSTLLNTRKGLESLKSIDWRKFEMLVGEAFRRQGYSIAETGLGGADGGIDLILHKHSNVILVQCKQWRKKNVDVRIVREMYGLMVHHHAHSVKIVCVGNFTADAKIFAEGKPIELITGEKLLSMINEAQGYHPSQGTYTIEDSPVRIAKSSHPLQQRWVPKVVDNSPIRLAKISHPIDTDNPDCPKCGAFMVARANGRTKEPFWGCSHYPKCRGMLAR